MQIGMVAGNNMHFTVGKAARIKSQSVQAPGSMFGAPYKVTISKEGRRLSEPNGAFAYAKRSGRAQAGFFDTGDEP